MAGYDTPVQATSDVGFVTNLDVTFGFVNQCLDTVLMIATEHGWTGDGGTLANTIIHGLGIPFHDPTHDPTPSQVPSSAIRMGWYDGIDFLLFDPLASPPDTDPTGDTDGFGCPIVGVALGTTPDATIGNFNNAATAATRWDFALGTQDPLTGGSMGPVIAKNPGPTGNVDGSSSRFAFVPDGSNTAGNPPLDGGWYMLSTPAPVTGDQIRVWVYEGEFNNFRVQAQLNGNDCVAYPLFSSHYYFFVCPYQMGFQEKPNQPRNPGDVAGLINGGGYQLISALHVPAEFGPSTQSISNVDTTPLQPVTITTTVPHPLKPGDRIKIGGVGGATEANGTWWVASTPTDTTLTVSSDRMSILDGDSSIYTAMTGTITYGIWEACIATGDMANKFSAGGNTTFVKALGIFKTSWSSPRASFFDFITMPVVNIGTNADGITSLTKPMVHAPYVAVRILDDNGHGTGGQAKIIGHLWDAFIELKRQPKGTFAEFLTKPTAVWLEDHTTLPLVQASLWLLSG